jgi:Domain of unknown function (DUF4377)
MRPAFWRFTSFAFALNTLALGIYGIEDGETSKTIIIAGHKTECVDVGTRLCLLMQRADKGKWELLFEPIEGLHWKWGFRYRIRVREEVVNNPPADASALRFRLVELVARERIPPDELFRITLSSIASEDGRPLIKQLKPNLFIFHDEQVFGCATRAVCESIADRVRQKQRLTIEFTHSQNASAPLTAHRVVDSHSGGSVIP